MYVLLFFSEEKAGEQMEKKGDYITAINLYLKGEHTLSHFAFSVRT